MTVHGHKDTLDRLLASWKAPNGPHGWILTGPEGIGKGLVAREAIRAHFGLGPDATHPDVIVLEPTDHGTRTPSITVDDVRAMAQQLRLTPAQGGRRFALIDPADAMTESAANALLKILEEPPAGAVLILVVHALGALPETVRSRCAIERCAGPDARDAAAIVAANAEIDAGLAPALLALADGSPGLAVQYAQAGAHEIYAALIEALARPTPFERTGLQAWADRAAKLWPTTPRLVATLLHRAARKAAGAADPDALFPNEATLLTHLAQHGLARLGLAWDLVQRIARDTETSALDTRYAGVRILLALEHSFRPRVPGAAAPAASAKTARAAARAPAQRAAKR